MERCDVAVNIFAKPFQTALTLLSLLKASGSHISSLWLQFEPAGSRYDTCSPYEIATYLREEVGIFCHVFQPEIWFDCDVADKSRFKEEPYRMGLRYACAFEHSQSRLLFLTHNDVFFQKDILGLLIAGLGDAFAAGPLGQCWNCPASSDGLMQSVLSRPPCRPHSYTNFQPNPEQLRSLYRAADTLGAYRRSYTDGLDSLDFAWPLPECRINEWACLIDLAQTRPLTIPFGEALPIGAYEHCGSHTLDIGVSWFRAMHRHGLKARHIPTDGYFTHWVGTGSKSRLRYTQSEDRAKRLLERLFPDYMAWLRGRRQKAKG